MMNIMSWQHCLAEDEVCATVCVVSPVHGAFVAPLPPCGLNTVGRL